ncbi:hypothetical protein WJX81_004782 [Elliptochloris bilobata]|uniref:Uncharacterized protein n=1 Tax=Elliptochloris bilobata TaxID=381761 RepID=A0AAW1S7L3_9CHLO
MSGIFSHTLRAHGLADRPPHLTLRGVAYMRTNAALMRSIQWQGRGREAGAPTAAGAGEAAAGQPAAVAQGSGVSADACADALGQPKVALMFLTPGPMPHADVWATWLRASADLLRADCLAGRVCGEANRAAALAAVQAACANSSAGANAASQLFSVYVHPPPAFRGYPAGSVFRGREVPNRVKVKWGEYSVVEASRALLREALKDPLNKRFVLLSETCNPLLPAATVYTQLMAESKSRINACAMSDRSRNVERWAPEMEAAGLQRAHWRKSSMWSMLVRKHAQAVVDDTEVAASFRAHCKAGKDDSSGKVMNCIPDEHYLASLLAAKGLEEETDCIGAMTYIHWWGNWKKMQPETYVRDEVCGDLIEQMRMSEYGCDNPGAIASTPGTFARLEDLATGRCRWAPAPFEMLSGQCHVFSRKWGADTADAVLGLFELEETLQMLDGRSGACAAEVPKQAPTAAGALAGARGAAALAA